MLAARILVATPLCVVAYLAIEGRVGWRAALGIALAVTGALALVFEGLMGGRLWRGLLLEPGGWPLG